MNRFFFETHVRSLRRLRCWLARAGYISFAPMLSACAPTPPSVPAKVAPPLSATPKARVVVFVWDGLRPDTAQLPELSNLGELARRGSVFSDHHAVYPSFTMMNAASLATGAFPGSTGFFGNVLWQPRARGRDAAGKELPFWAPIFTEDDAVLLALNQSARGQLLLTETIFQASHRVGLRTAAVGKVGPVLLQDLQRAGLVMDEQAVWPPALVEELQKSGVALPALSEKLSNARLRQDNGNPTRAEPKYFFADGVTPDPTNREGSPYSNANTYLMQVFTRVILPRYSPDLSLIWLRNPDSTQHVYGPGTANARAALVSQDLLLGMLLDGLKQQQLLDGTDVIVVSDHAHSSVSGPLDLFPLRSVRPSAEGQGNTWGEPDPSGYSASGDVRMAALLGAAGFSAYDGFGCIYDPVMSGITAQGVHLYEERLDVDGKICGRGPNYRFTTPSFEVPRPLPNNALIVATNGGSDYIYAPDHDAATIANVVRFLQSREEVGAIFVAGRYGSLPGTLPLSVVQLESAAGRSPDVVYSYAFDEHAVVQGLRGTVFQSANPNNHRGMHGSFSPLDVHNTLIAVGPHFRAGFTDALPSSNVDLAPTVAKIFGLTLPRAAGRALEEALRPGRALDDYRVSSQSLSPARAASGLAVKRADGTADAKANYTFELETKVLTVNGARHVYFDRAKAKRW